MPFSRPLTGMERLWLVSERLAPGFAIALIVEGEGSFSEEDVRVAVGRWSEAWPILRCRVVGALGWTRWREAGLSPRVETLTGLSWPERGPLDPRLQGRPLDPWRGPAVEVLLAPDQRRARLILRVHHAMFDGRAVLAVCADLFRALRGEALVGQGPWVDDQRLVERAAQGPGAPEAQPGRTLWPGRGRVMQRGQVYARARFQAPTSGLTARALAAIRDAGLRRWQAWGEPVGRERFFAHVPVDLRPRSGELSHAPGNLTGLARLHLGDEALSEALARAVPGAGQSVREASGLKALPLGLLALLGRRGAVRSHTSGQTDLSFTFSNIGRVSLGDFEAPGFVPRSLGVCPPGGPGIPLLAVLVGHEEGLELCGSAPVGMSSAEDLTGLLAEVGESLDII